MKKSLTKDELIKQIHDFVNKNNGIAPTSREMKNQGYASIKSFIKYFGSFKNALVEAGVFDLRKDKYQFCDTYTDEQLLDLLKLYMKDKNRIPTIEIMKKNLSPSVITYHRRFGSVFNALKIIGHDYSKQQEQDLIELENDMINKYKHLKDILNRVPSSRDIEEYSRIYKFGYSMSTYEFHFGSLYELQILCGFNPTVIGRNKSRKELLNDLVFMSNELGKTPSQLDIKYFDTIASCKTYTNNFGSWTNAIKEAKLKQISKIYYSTKGVICLSYYELLFTNMLEEFNIKFKKEVFYKEYINTDRKFRFDYVLYINNKKYFVEIFGMMENKTYEERVKYKKQLCKENNINLIEIYPKHFSTYKLEEIYTMLLTIIN